MDNQDIQVLVQSGYTDIYFVDSEWKEESGGVQNETDTYETVAKKEGKYYAITSIHYSKTLGGDSRYISSTQLITQAEYNVKGVVKNRRIDTPDYFKWAKEQKKGFDLQQELLGSRQKCSRCGAMTKLRSGPRGDFWGCSKYSSGSCSATKNLTPRQKKIVTALKTIENKCGRGMLNIFR